MQELKSLADELRRRHRVEASFEDGELTLPLGGEEIRVCEDAEHRRVVLWSEVATHTQRDALAAAEISIAFNQQFAFEKSVSLGLSSEADCAILGRSTEIETPLDTTRLLEEARGFLIELSAAKTFFREAVLASRERAQQGPPSHSANDESYIKI